ncbi:hypothetical protein LEP1GSC038_3264 [Leptospira weilii str. 2006001855]|uniref:Uncharacterized protein n=2 Tax=Leptospira weilii TaxID=28184 RepID=M6QQG4_9LEPT|nr:hypothetical protein LEP1GSC038_3264 [Leptospira weilii str. 2006001855]EMN91062.1 hypothetical protein LEP1GSC108_4257 [Leptospira weilii str. UI 13098]OMI17286.1 hypothetical protein BUQ74_10930 [Leptospira weilii serovar Heyan]
MDGNGDHGSDFFLTDSPDQCDRLLAIAGGKLSDTAFELVLVFFTIPSFQIFEAVKTKIGRRGF